MPSSRNVLMNTKYQGNDSIPLDKEFKNAVKYIANPSNSTGKITNETRLRFYALYQQATKGKNTNKAPSRLQIIKRKNMKLGIN